MKVITYTDGGSRGNPGPAAYGVYIMDENGKKLTAFGKKLGVATNNVAEYTAIIEALRWIVKNKESLGNVSEIEARMDSQLACRQLTGMYKVKNEMIRGLFHQVQVAAVSLGVPIVYKHVPREQNTMADAQVNFALDN